ncbi:polysaccharide pyruvyl transferase family protein [Noviherbaspirillum aridicola]|uniref:Polysaccharide pyruvyl transferase domain-containing protein n=1 Tax=Noviherbaspirillum aridicola TaxID=2849687 RepID=A0ABQ4Q6U4_9BURK|nr:polysaccharide pyruvyl transferase family protein [Noviherbaspirillum aridicola]GIZ52510.1 hypothetical protein NCCP691_25240 [Noviherbaspirillum aridicola]
MRTINIGLLWHSLDSPNLGVAALTHAQMHLAGEVARSMGIEPRFSLLGWVQDGASPSAGAVARACRVNGKRLLGLEGDFHRAVKQCDIVLDIGEGDSFSDIYGWKRLAYLAGTKVVARLHKRPLVMSPQTLGPFRHPLARRIGDFVMAHSRAVFSRDGLSTEYFQGRGLDVEFHEAIDVAFALPFERAPRTAGRVRVGINVSGLLWSGGYTGNNQFGLTIDYRDAVLRVIDEVSAGGDADIVLVPHVITADRAAEDDLRVSQEIARMRPGVTVAPTFASPVEAKSFISGLDFFTGARMHACIAAFSSGVPCVPMAYSRKFTGLFNTLGYPHVADCTRETTDQVVARIVDACNQRARLAEQVAAGNVVAQRRLDQYKATLGRIFAEVEGAHEAHA